VTRRPVIPTIAMLNNAPSKLNILFWLQICFYRIKAKSGNRISNMLEGNIQAALYMTQNKVATW
jgi:hypothetical protein